MNVLAPNADAASIKKYRGWCEGGKPRDAMGASTEHKVLSKQDHAWRKNIGGVMGEKKEMKRVWQEG
jgi:hypothetical protein